MEIKKKLNPTNFYPGRPTGISGLVLHTTEGNFPGDLNWLAATASRVSCHYLVTKEGEIWQIVEDHNRAWHAGHVWGNQECIGIEISHIQGQTCPPKQIEAVTELSRSLVEQYGIRPGNVVTHRKLTPWAKIDPTNWNDAEFAAWVKSLYGIDPDHEQVHGIDRYHVVPRGLAVVRSSPKVEDDNVVMTLKQYHPVIVNSVVRGQWIGDDVTGSDRWMHWETDLGFIHESGLVREV